MNDAGSAVPPPSRPQWLVAPKACCFALFPSAPPVVWCGLVWLCPLCPALFPSTPLWCGVVVPAARPLISSSSSSSSSSIMVGTPSNPLYCGVLCPPPPWCGVACPPLLPPVVWCGCARGPAPTAAMSIPSGGKSPLSQGSAVFDS